MAGEYATLAGARQKFPFVRSLKQELDWAAIQLAITTAAAQGGGEVQMPRGVCRLSDTVEITTTRGLYSGDRVQLVGQGSGVTQLLANVAADKPALQFKGTYGPLSEQNVTARGFSIFSAEAARVGYGLHLNQVNALGFEDIMISGFDRCVDAVDSVTIRFSRARIMNCNTGVHARSGVFSRPNAWSFYDPIMTGHNFFAIRMDNPASLLIQGGDFENNGLLAPQGLAATIYLKGNPMDGVTGLVLIGAYFQLNRGLADVLIEAGGAQNGAHVVVGTEFSRTSDREFVVSHVHLANDNEAAKTNLTIMATSFGGFNDYFANEQRPAILIKKPTATNFVLRTFNNFYWSEIETPPSDRVTRLPEAAELDRLGRAVNQLERETDELRLSLRILNACFQQWLCRWFGIR